ncbi:hypothetical protein ABOM_006117 [Aspergillus bombycis]|uniref:Uncharacterized protein n=1 Tax=Aspergillus bombycis TaxID=109264 RepID=A0A1F7ZZH8_9EURO|nr:hypothetical protein ABOM_006117 [Aspergillus bombycis]OGM44851.1 hypothetical protein ABOM_006117 [Aspergillus bombycis]
MASIASRSSLFESPLVPRSSQQWKAALQGVKLLYVQRQYKQCTVRATELLEKSREPVCLSVPYRAKTNLEQLHPVYKTYLYFYSAVCYEEMGRAAHRYSSTKVPLLQGALDRFDICSTVLPSPLPVSSRPSEESNFPSLEETSSPSEFSDSPSTICSLVSSITDIIDKTMQWKEEDPFISDSDSCPDMDIGTMATVADGRANQLLIPPPLRLKKSSDEALPLKAVLRDSGHTSVRVERSDRARLPPPLPLKIVPRAVTGKYERTMDSLLSNRDSRLCTDGLLIDLSERKAVPATPQYSDSIRRYNSSIRSLRSQIDSSINSIHVLVDEVEEKQHTRKMAKTIKRSASFWSFSPVQGGDGCWEKVGGLKRSPGKETKQERIDRLRAEEWKTVGLRSAARGWKGGEYYKEYCSSVLDELYLES